MIYSIIPKSQLEGAHRLDAEYYQPEYLLIDRYLNKHKVFSLGSISERITQGPNPVFQGEGYICLNGRNIKNYRLEENNSNYVSKEEYQQFQNFHVKKGDILITLKGLGSIGKIGYVQRDISAMFSRDIGLIRIADKNLSAFVFTFLLSKYGYYQIEKSITGSSGQLTLGTSIIKNIILPNLNSDHISSLVHESESLYEKSSIYYIDAEKTLIKELSLDSFDSYCGAFSIVKLSDCQNASRIDAEYFQPKYEKLTKIIQTQNQKSFNEVIENVPAKFDPAREPDRAFNYVELSNINSSIGLIDGSSEVLGKEAPSRAKRVLKENDVIVSSVEGSLGKVALVDKEHKNYLASTGFFQLRSKEILPEVLLVMAKSIVFQMQLEQRCAGTILTAVPKESVNDVVVPILPKETQRKIANLVRKSHEARKKSKQLLDEAKRKVEELIEKGV